MPELVVGSQLTGGSGYRIDYALVGYLTQALYDYQNKYSSRHPIVATVLHVLRRRPAGEISGRWVLGIRPGRVYGKYFRLVVCLDSENELWCAGK